MQTAQGELRGARGMSTYYQTWQPEDAARALPDQTFNTGGGDAGSGGRRRRRRG